MKLWKKVLLIFVLFIGLFSAGFVWWANSTQPILPEATSALISDGKVLVTEGKYLVFSPVNIEAEVGYIFYPGGKVDYRAYAPYARRLAENGYLAVIVKMPLNLAVFGINRAEGVISDIPQVKDWVIGGHSLGGSMAANYLVNHQEAIDGLVLLASYPAESDNLSSYAGLVTSISSTLDGLATQEKIAASIPLLPATTRWVSIEGGNHANFGWYGEQPGDNPAEISREQQQDVVFNVTLNMLTQILLND